MHEKQGMLKVWVPCPQKDPALLKGLHLQPALVSLHIAIIRAA